MPAERSTPHSMPRDRPVTLPVLLVLLLALGGAAYLVIRAHREALAAEAEGPVAERADHGDLDPSAPGAWRHHDWAGVEDPSGRGALLEREGPEVAPHEEDPQARAMRRSYPVDGDAGVALPFAPLERLARIVASEGALAVPADSSCQVRVLPVRARELNCLVRVMCDGHVLYPNPTQTAGYAPCEVESGRPVRAVDDGPTASDGDPLVRFDLHEGLVTVEDRGEGVTPFRATLRL